MAHGWAPRHAKHWIQEFRDMVKALHKAGICVILDVVFNHTAEVGANGPTINFAFHAIRLGFTDRRNCTASRKGAT